MSIPIVTINLVVLNGQRYIRHCLDGILAQTYPHELIEFNIFDNGSTDETIKIITDYGLRIKNTQSEMRNSQWKFNLVKSKLNLGMWPGQEELLKYSNGKYVLAMAVDVILDKDFVKNAVQEMEKDERIGALQAKIYKYDLIRNSKSVIQKSDIIDTCGFKIFKSRRITNIGHGEEDKGQYDNLGEIFGVEGAAPFFRKEALQDCTIFFASHNGRDRSETLKSKYKEEEIVDHDYFWYGDDLDLAWRLNLFGWKQIFAPSVIAWHDRQTTKSLKKNWLDYILRVPVRRQIPIKKRRLDWKNTRFTIIKNEYIINVLKDLPRIAAREAAVFGYTLLFEPKVFLEIPHFIKLLPKMIKKRRAIMAKSKIKAQEIHKWYK